MKAADKPQKKITEKDEASIIASALESLNARISALEAPQDESLFSKLQKKGSFFALFIGIILSTISLFDLFWSKPEAAQLQYVEEFNRAVNNVGSLRQNLIKLSFESKNPQMMLEIHAVVLPQILANIQYATALLPKIKEHAGIPQLIILISEAINIYDWQSAKKLVAQATSTKNAIPSMRSEALRQKARLHFLTGDPKEGRIAYTESLQAIRNESGFGINGNRAYIASEWTTYEFLNGDCEQGNKRAGEFVEYLKHPHISPAFRTGLIETLRNQIQNMQVSGKGCSSPKILLDLSSGTFE